MANIEVHTTQNSFANTLNVCGGCKESLQGKEPKLLPCLHTFCKHCILSECVSPEKASTLRCMLCKSECHPRDVVDNQFCFSYGGAVSDSVDQTEEKRTCTSCEENAFATSFCIDCSEWLCDGCVLAHKRVRVTKDHTIKSRENASDSSNSFGSRQVFCRDHKQELLRLFCETCDQLTCRDCQLLHHKEHKYQFVDEASNDYKDFLTNFIVKLKEKQLYVDNAKALIDRRNQEIDRKEKIVSNDIKAFAVKLIAEINKRGKKLLYDLNSICGGKMQQLGHKQNEINTLSNKLEHVLKFAEFTKGCNNNPAVLYSKKLLIAQLKQVLRTRCEVPNPYHVVDIKLKYDENALIGALSQQGVLYVDGVPYNNNTSQMQITMCPRPGAINSNGVSSPSSRHANFSNSNSIGSDSRNNIIKGVRFPGGSNPNAGVVQPPFTQLGQQQMPIHVSAAQSSMVSSSNNNKPNTNLYYPNQPNTNTPNIIRSSAQLINLAQLQQQRLMRKQQYPVGYHKPIVIQPSSTSHSNENMYQSTRSLLKQGVSSSDAISPIEILPDICGESSGSNFVGSSIADSSRNHTNSTGYVKPEQSERPSCSFSGNSLKKELNNFPMFNLNPCDINFDADPESLIESIKKEAKSFVQPPSFPLMNENTQNTISTDNSDLSFCGFDDLFPIVNVAPSSDYPGKLVDPPQIDDPNEDYCAVCHNGGDLVCCDMCPKVFHLSCHVPTLRSSPSGVWRCGLCPKPEDLVLNVPVLREEDNVPIGSKRKAPIGLTDKERKVAERILLELFSHEASVPFHCPVPKSVPNYYKVVTHPLDFSTIKSKLIRQNSKHYQKLEEFVADLRLVFNNCASFNSGESEVGIAGRAVEEFFNEKLSFFIPYLSIRCITPSSDTSSSCSISKKKRSDRDKGENILSSSSDSIPIFGCSHFTDLSKVSNSISDYSANAISSKSVSIENFCVSSNEDANMTNNHVICLDDIDDAIPELDISNDDIISENDNYSKSNPEVNNGSLPKTPEPVNIIPDDESLCSVSEDAFVLNPFPASNSVTSTSPSSCVMSSTTDLVHCVEEENSNLDNVKVIDINPESIASDSSNSNLDNVKVIDINPESIASDSSNSNVKVIDINPESIASDLSNSNLDNVKVIDINPASIVPDSLNDNQNINENSNQNIGEDIQQSVVGSLTSNMALSAEQAPSGDSVETPINISCSSNDDESIQKSSPPDSCSVDDQHISKENPPEHSTHENIAKDNEVDIAAPIENVPEEDVPQNMENDET